MRFRSARLALIVITTALLATWYVGRGPGALLYLLWIAGLTAPGLPLGFALFGMATPVGWIAGAIMGYPLAAFDVWVASALHAPGRLGFAAVTALTLAVTAALTPRRWRAPLVPLAPWTGATSAGYLCVAAVTVALAAPPLANVGKRDRDGNLRYRAYFTADFVWHTALTSELTRFAPLPTNPYLAPERMHYYWGYFLVPAAIVHSGPAPLRDVERVLRLNALLSGLLLMSTLFVAGLTAVRQPFAAAAGTLLALLASSLEGLYEIVRLWLQDRPLALVRGVNIDALTAWDFQGHRIDGLARCLWYVPQHAMAYALGVIALIVAGAAGADAPFGAVLLAGAALGGATILNPFVGGIFAIVWGLAVAIDVLRRRRARLPALARQSVAAVPVALGVAWCVHNRMVEGAAGALELGFSGASTQAPVLTFLLSFGPVLVAAAGGAIWMARHKPQGLVPACLLAATSVMLIYLVRLNVDHAWVPFRAGQMLLAAMAVMSAAFFAAPVRPLARRAVAATGVLLLAAGTPTTLIDAYNAQDTGNVGPGPGFRWTLLLSREQQDAFTWIRSHTLRSTVVQMEPMVRQRDSWSLIPSFAQRDMAAGLPISLLHVPDYDQRSEAVRSIYAGGDPAAAARLAHAMRISYLYVDQVDRRAYGSGVAKFDSSPEFFQPVFREGPVGIYQVR